MVCRPAFGQWECLPLDLKVQQWFCTGMSLPPWAEALVELQTGGTALPLLLVKQPPGASFMLAEVLWRVTWVCDQVPWVGSTCTWETAVLSPSDVGRWSFTVCMRVGLWVKWNRKRGGLSVSVFQHVQPICMSASHSPSSPPQHVPKDHVVQGLESTRSLSVSYLTCIINKGRRHMPLWLVLELKPFAWGGVAPGTRELWFPLLVSHLLFSYWKRSEKERLVKGLYPNIWSLRNQSGFKPRNYLDRLLSAWLVLVQEEENQTDIDISLPKGAQKRRQVDRWKQQQSRQTALRRGCLLCWLKWWWPVR